VKTRDQSPKKDTRLSARVPRAPTAGPPSLLRLQRAVGNQAVLRLLGQKAQARNEEPLTINEPGDRFEREADAVADQVMRAPSAQTGGSGKSLSMSDHGNKLQRRCSHCEEEEEKNLHRQLAPASAGGGIQRKCSQCEEEEEKRLHRKEDGSSAPNTAPAIVHDVLRAPGQPLDSGTRNFMEPRFGRDFSPVRVHTDEKAAESARVVQAQAYTVGNDVVFDSRQYAPESDAGRRLLAHELTHVVQQTHGPAGLARQQAGTGTRTGTTTGGTPQGQPPVVAAPGLTIGPSCAGHEAEITAAWLRATAMLRDTISDLDNVVSAMRLPGGPRRIMPSQTACIMTSFGDVGGLDGAEAGESTFTLLSTVIQNFQRIQSGFSAGRTVRCDPQTVPDNECTWRSAFVVTGNDRDIFLCQNFFSPENSVAIRAATLIHEMAHSVLRITHRGIPEMTFPATFFDYSSPLGLDFDDAKRNAFAYEILANCLRGEPPTPIGSGATQPARTGVATGREARASVSLLGGATVTPAIQGLAGVAGRLSLRPGSLVIFNPYIGLNVLYSPTTAVQPAGFFTGMAEAGLRIQQPARGAYLDIGGGGFAGFEAPLGAPLRTTAGLSASAGAGWRWERIELGAEARALFPLTSGDPDRVVVLGRFAVRFGQ
jgi:hypothetical protein